MKLAVNTYPFLFVDDLVSSCETIAKAGYQAIELVISPPHFDLDTIKTGSMSKLKKRLEGFGISVSSMLYPSIDINLCSPFPEMREMSVQLYKKASEIALELNCHNLVLAPGRRHVLLPPPMEYILKLARESVMKIVEYTQYTDLIVNVETMPANFIDSVQQTVEFVDSLDNPRIKICFDLVNVNSVEDVNQGILKAGNRINIVHLADGFKGKGAHVAIGSGEIDFQGVLSTLKKAEFNGLAVIEMIDDQKLVSINKSREFLEGTGWRFD